MLIFIHILKYCCHHLLKFRHVLLTRTLSCFIHAIKRIQWLLAEINPVKVKTQLIVLLISCKNKRSVATETHFKWNISYHNDMWYVRLLHLKRFKETMLSMWFRNDVTKYSGHDLKLMERKALRKHSLHEKTPASVLLKLFISGNEWCHTTDAP